MSKQPIVILAAALMLIAGCTTTFENIKSKPEIYAGTDARIRAEVELEIPIPFMKYSVYKLNDDTDIMFMFSSNEYTIGDTISANVHVIGMTEASAEGFSRRIMDQTADYLVEKGITERENAASVSRKIVALISTLGSLTEGSYFLMENQ